METPTKEHVVAVMKFGDKVAYGFDFIEYENREMAEKGVVTYKQRYKEIIGDNDMQSLMSPRRPFVMFYGPVNAEAAQEATDKINRVLTIARAQ